MRLSKMSDATQTDAKPDSISLGLIVNFKARTVRGFGHPGLMDSPVKITGVNEVAVAFGGSNKSGWPLPAPWTA